MNYYKYTYKDRLMTNEYWKSDDKQWWFWKDKVWVGFGHKIRPLNLGGTMSEIPEHEMFLEML